MHCFLLVVDLDVKIGGEDGAEIAEVVVAVNVDLLLVAFEHSLVKTQHIDNGFSSSGTIVPLVDAQPKRGLFLYVEEEEL